MYKKRNVELLAPAGTFDIFQSVIDAACDAVYCGGERLNMRMIRKGYNLSDRELKEAVAMAEDRNKCLYITFNSLLEEDDLTEASDYLDFLQEIRPHGLIVQDLAIVKLAREKQIDIPLHSSVMMNIHNLDQIRFLEEHGFRRVVLSREMSLDQIRFMAENSDMELEYFTHGDMCVAHGSQCLYSSYLFGMSSNRGRCLKPCRWPFTVSGLPGAPSFPLAVKDLNMYGVLGQMVNAGVHSFKIEGRMRDKEFITALVNRYGEALDRVLDDPLASLADNPEDLDEFKKRDFSTGYAFGRPGRSNINSRGEGSGMFYSTGKMFSTPTEETPIPLNKRSEPKSDSTAKGRNLKLRVRVESVEQADLALEAGVDRIYLSTEPFAPLSPPSMTEIGKLSERCTEQGCELFLSHPKMSDRYQSELFRCILAKNPPLDGFLISHTGSFTYLQGSGYRIACDSSMNSANSKAVALLQECGAESCTASLELPYPQLLALPGACRREDGKDPLELLLHGRPTLMYMDHDLGGEERDGYELIHSAGSLPVRRDCWGRYHLLPEKELSLLPRLEELITSGYTSFRVDVQGYPRVAAGQLLSAVRRSLDYPGRAIEQFCSLRSIGGGFTYGGHQ